MKTEYLDRIRCAQLRNRVTGADNAATWIKDGMTVGMSGFTRAGDVKLVPAALAERAKKEPLKITLLTGASLGRMRKPPPSPVTWCASLKTRSWPDA
jgi:succinyl-CoA:acetate CoA-transferase